MSDVKISVKKPVALKYLSSESIVPTPPQSVMTSLMISDEKLEDQQRTTVLHSLNQQEKAKFIILEKAVANHCLYQQPIDLAQYLIVSHLEIPESLSRIKKWREIMRKW